MSTYTSLKQQCDECGRDMLKAHRIQSGRRFCGTCYQRVFKSRQCPRCGILGRLLKSDPNAICRQCVKDAPCARCGKTEYKIGKITLFGPVCNSCSVYFRPPRLPLQPVKGEAQQLVKSHDQTVFDRGTCQDCRRHRSLSVSPEGRKLCSVCLRDGLVPCPCCGNDMPAGRGNACEDCYWKNTYLKRLRLDEEGLSSSQFVQIFHRFGMWLLEQVPAQKAALTIHGYFPFFYEMEKRWGKVPSYAQLLIHFTAEGLRRVRLPMRWLSETLQVVVDAQEREDASDLRRIAEIVASLPVETPAAQVLAAYNSELQTKIAAGRVSIRTARLALRPAASLLATCAKSGFQLPGQDALDSYLLNAPGQKASIFGFVSFMNSQHAANLVVRVDDQKTRSMRRKQLEAEMVKLLEDGQRDDAFEAEWISISLAYFHGLPRRVGKKSKIFSLSTDVDGNFSVFLNGNTYFVPHWDFRPGSGGTSKI